LLVLAFWARSHPLLAGLAAAGVMLAAALAVLWPLTDFLAAHDVAGIPDALRTGHLQTARENVRTELVTVGAGLFAAGALFYTARNFALAQNQLEQSRQAATAAEQAQRRTLELTEQRQVTERYTKAIEQLGSDKLDVRLGGIYALERIARDSARDHPTVIDVLAAFVREHSREEWTTEGMPATRPDVQAAVTVIGRRDTSRDAGQVNLVRARLSAADLRRGDFSGATFYKADLAGAVFQRTRLARAVFRGANLSRCYLGYADLQNANLVEADLTDADLAHANLSHANLQNACLTRANLMSASLAEAGLLTPTIDDAVLEGADLTGSMFPQGKQLPMGWTRDPATSRPMRSDEASPGR
jgi:uncharacterized protein YjbI with pentapeptide repeats